jgi:hypothetical protein
MHLTGVDFVDLADGTRPEASAPHLASCAHCRQQLLEMRSLMVAATSVQVPEPSPLFWDHLSDRVREAVAAEHQLPRRWWSGLPWRRMLIPASAVPAAAILIVSAWAPGVPTPPPIAPKSAIQPAFATAPAAGGGLNDGFDDAVDDESLTLVADLSAGLNVDPATDTNLAPNGSAEHAVSHLNDAELRELQLLLKQELASSGA